MVATDGATTPALTPIARNIREYSMFQGVQLVLERLRHAHPDLDDEALYERLELQANPSMGFPGSEIESVRYFEEHGELRACLRVNLVSLFGAGSPLPAFYGEQALGDSADGNPTRLFMDLFNNRLQRLLLPVWQKYRYHARFSPGARDSVSALLFSLIGLSGDTIRNSTELNWKRLLPYLGLLSLRAQSAAMIESVLRYYFKHEQLHIEQCMEREVGIPGDQRCQLGLGNSTLGDSLVLGERVRDRSGKFRIHILNLDWARFHDFLPPGCDNQPLRVLIRFVLRTPLDYDVRLHLRPDDIHELRLGAGNACRLGWTSWLGCEHADGMVTLGSCAP